MPIEGIALKFIACVVIGLIAARLVDRYVQTAVTKWVAHYVMGD
jgi:hypothetical protein